MIRVRVLKQVTLLTLREFLRTPAALFWTYGFPLVMALSLGMAFRSSKPLPLDIAVVESDFAVDQIEALRTNQRLHPEMLSRAERWRDRKGFPPHMMPSTTATDDAPRSVAACRWCAGLFDVKTIGGNRKEFCGPNCKGAYHTALRMWAQRALDGGLITVDDLRSG